MTAAAPGGGRGRNRLAVGVGVTLWPRQWQVVREDGSVPYELRGRHLVFYDCDGNVAGVEAVTREWQGCVLEAPSQSYRARPWASAL